MIQGQSKPRVLIVEDSRSNAMLISAILKEFCDPLVVDNGEDALIIADTQPIDLILLDVMLPGVDGYHVCAHLKNNQKTINIPVIFLSGLSEENNEARGLALGAVDYISKPIRPIIVEMRVRNHLELKRRGDLLAQLANIDALTGLPNRRQFDEMLVRECQRERREKNALSLLMIDVDHFKLFNDFYGHPEGDKILRLVAGALQAALHRGGDFVARYGGEEFVVILPNTDKSGAEKVADTLLSEVRALNLPHEKSTTSRYVSISIGGVTAHADQLTQPDLVLQLADQQLYVAKQAGRNRYAIT